MMDQINPNLERPSLNLFKVRIELPDPSPFAFLVHLTESNPPVVTLPEGVSAGQTIHVQSPNGQTNAIVVPAGFGPGSTFTVEFAEEEAPPPAKADFAQPVYAAPTNTGTNGNVNADDGFASGFNNPGWTSPPASAVPANDTLVYAEPDIQLGSSYPTTTATPVYNTAPQYPK